MTGSGAARKRGFTLVELMVVIAIIALLVGILVPAISTVRRSAKVASTRATLGAMGTGLETYKADSKVGGSYPPSYADAGGTLAWGSVKSPYTNNPIHITGAGLLVWALQGADGLGTPGFAAKGNKASWRDMSGNQAKTPPEPSDLYSLDASGQPSYARSGPYIEAGKVKLTPNKGQVTAPNFAVPNDQNTNAREFPMYLDTFDQPILYWRADTAGRHLIDKKNQTDVGTAQGVAAQDRGIYHWEDNAALFAATEQGGSWLVNLSGETGGGHGLKLATSAYSQGSPPPADTFQGFIYDTNVQAKFMPKQSSSYMLLSAGPDGKYGTADDVANFEVGSAK